MPQKGYKQTKDHRNKLSRLNKLGITGMLGKHQSNRQKIIASQTHKNKFVSLDTRKKMSLAKLNDKDLSARNKRNRAKQISPVKDTSIEVKIQDYLKELNIEFFTHQYIKEIEHSYQCDILIPSLNLVIECDGNYWHHYPIGNDIDHIRTNELLDKGFKILRLWEVEIREMDLKTFKEKLDIYS